ncbi:DUF1287 domain-containing protein [Salmonella enterica]|uniref:DUF1287 domain-containing protein n=1 Tax=Salmonella enterica TaxID=28901 RepID=UPI003F5D4ECF
MKFAQALIVILAAFFISHISHHSPRSDTRPITVQAQTNAAIAQSAGTQIGKTLFYDAAYVRLDYPNGDLPLERGVCADVVIRALRSQQVDLQKRVHEDMQAHFSAYPNNWKLKRPDSNIDHRRVPNLETWFQRHNKALPVTDKYSDYQPGDIVSWLKRRTKNAKAFHDKCENFSFRASNETAVLITAFYSLHGDHLGYG